MLCSMLAALILYCVHITISLIAFANLEDLDCLNFPCTTQKIYSINMIGLSPIGYIVAYYTLGNLFPIVLKTITLRNIIMGLVFPEKV